MRLPLFSKALAAFVGSDEEKFDNFHEIRGQFEENINS